MPTGNVTFSFFLRYPCYPLSARPCDSRSIHPHLRPWSTIYKRVFKDAGTAAPYLVQVLPSISLSTTTTMRIHWMCATFLPVAMPPKFGCNTSHLSIGDSLACSLSPSTECRNIMEWRIVPGSFFRSSSIPTPFHLRLRLTGVHF